MPDPLLTDKMKDVPSRVHILLARQSPVAVAIRRGPSKRVHCRLGQEDGQVPRRPVAEGPHLRAAVRSVAGRAASHLLRRERQVAFAEQGLLDGDIEGPVPEGGRALGQRQRLEWRRPLHLEPVLLAERIPVRARRAPQACRAGAR
jgi:hypothetical protein